MLLGLAAGTAAQARTIAENEALRALCPIGLKADGIWGNQRINAAIATIGFRSNWPDRTQATAYKLGNAGGYLN